MWNKDTISMKQHIMNTLSYFSLYILFWEFKRLKRMSLNLPLINNNKNTITMTKWYKREKNLIFDNIKWRPQNLYDSVLPVSIINWITGFFILEYPLGKPRPALTYIYTFINISIYWILFFFNNHKITFNFLNILVRNVFLAIMYMNIFIATVSILINWYYNKVRFSKVISNLIKSTFMYA